jgi:hypothetical protein
MSCFGWGTKTGNWLSAPGSSTRVSDLRWKAGWGRLEREREREREDEFSLASERTERIGRRGGDNN